MPNMDLHEEVDNLVAQVPEGMVTTYGQVAIALGDIVASRFVGKVMSENDDTVRVPCRRVVQSDGSLGGYTGGGQREKKRALEAEGVRVEKGKIHDFDKILFTDFKTTHPLRKFRKIQIDDCKRLSLEDDFPADGDLAGSDVAYEEDEAFGALVVFSDNKMEPKKVVTIRTMVKFPYIPTYLTFREAPVVEELIKKLGEKPMLLQDGNGIIHTMGFGIASHIGVLLDIPSIGIAKKLLCGRVEGSGRIKTVRMDGDLAGYAVSGPGWKAPVYVSPGHRVSPKSVMHIIKPYWKYRIPEPVRIAHIEAGKERMNARP
jgi:deoxyribonuclease V